MSFNYAKNKEQGSQDAFWTSYSDLFLGLSTIFLLLYVTASLRTGTEGMRNQIENEKLTRKVQEMESQLKMYESVKNDYMANQATKDETQEYQELMDKLTLLQEDAKTEKERLLQEASENQQKVKALNKYQQMVRNVLNANKMAKSKVLTRDGLIKEQDVEIETQETQISDLNKDIQTKQQMIAQGEAQIKNTQAALQKRVNELRAAYKMNKISKNMFEQKIAQARADGQNKVEELKQVNAQYQEQLQQTNAQLGAVKNDLAQAQGSLEQTKGSLAQTQGLLQKKQGELQGLSGQLAKTAAEANALSGKLGQTQGLLQKKEGELQGLSGQLAKASAEAGALSGKLSQTQGELAKAKAEIDARKSVAGEIQRGFAKAGIKADIDMQTGDVVLDFGHTYFDSDSDRLKAEMKGVIEKAMPIYSRSLFGNPKVASKVSAVEVIGFASPTYQGRFVDPKSGKPEDKAALKYNMDLSYRRANSIFSYLLDERPNANFEHQQELLSLMKVSGRSFLEVMKVQNRNVATAAEFCKQNDCKKAQRVIIRFSMDQKK